MGKEGKRIGLALSGGGYRAAAYHIGTLRALNKLGILDKVDVISSVSGGSITAACYVQNKEKDYEAFEKEFIRKLTHNVLWIAIIRAVVMFAIFVVMFYFVPNSYFWYVLGGLILLLLLQ